MYALKFSSFRPRCGEKKESLTWDILLANSTLLYSLISLHWEGTCSSASAHIICSSMSQEERWHLRKEGLKLLVCLLSTLLIGPSFLSYTTLAGIGSVFPYEFPFESKVFICSCLQDGELSVEAILYFDAYGQILIWLGNLNLQARVTHVVKYFRSLELDLKHRFHLFGELLLIYVLIVSIFRMLHKSF